MRQKHKCLEGIPEHKLVLHFWVLFEEQTTACSALVGWGQTPMGSPAGAQGESPSRLLWPQGHLCPCQPMQSAHEAA